MNSPLDRESIPTYILTVVASDNGTPKALEDVTEVEISILDVNDNVPVFTKKVYSGSLNEDAPLGTKVRKR